MVIEEKIMGNAAGDDVRPNPRSVGETSTSTAIDDDRGVSHVVGVLLMIAITIMLISVIGVMALGFDAPAETAPRVASEGSFHLASGGSGPPTVALTHESGDIVDVSNVRVHITTNGGTVVKDIPENGDLSDGEWTSGEKLDVPVQTDDVCSGGEEADIRLVYHNEERTTTMAQTTVPLQASEFEIQGGAVVPEHDYNAEVEIIETEYGDGDTIWVEPVVGGNAKSSAFSPITQHTNVEPSQPAFVASDVSGGTGIRVRARADPTTLSTTWVNSNDAGVGSQVWVRRDGEPVPSQSGASGQADLEDTVSAYASGGQITLDDNQAIYMYELYTSDEDSNLYEYQDAVVLVTFTSASGTPEVREENGQSRIVCPS